MSQQRDGPGQGRPGMEEENQEGRQKLDLAVQVAHIAAQVSAVLLSGTMKKREDLETRLTLARERLEEQGAPAGLIPFIDTMRGLLIGQDVSALAEDLPGAYRAVYDRILADVAAQAGAGELTVGQVLDEVAHNVILVMTRGSFDQRRQMESTLSIMEQETERRPDLEPLADFLTAARLLLKGSDPTPIANGLEGPFHAKWDEIMDAVRG